MEFLYSDFTISKGKILDVHKIHLIIGKIGPQKAFEELKKNYSKE